MPSNLGVAVGDRHPLHPGRPAAGRPGGPLLDRRRAGRGLLADESSNPPPRRPDPNCSGIRYAPVFDYFADKAAEGAFVVIASDETTTEDGTGLVHMAPAYGEADFLAFHAAGLDVLVDPVDAEGRFTDEVPEVAGVNVKEADPTLIELMQEQRRPGAQRADRPLLPVLLAHRHPAHLQGDPHLVRRRRAVPRPDGRTQRVDPLGARARSAPAGSATGWRRRAIGPSAATASGVRASRCGNAMDCERAGLHRVARRAGGALGRPTRRPPQALRRRGHDAVLGVRRHHAPGARGPRCLVRVGRDALRPAPLPLRGPGGLRAQVPRRLHRRGPRSDPWLVLHPGGPRRGDLRHGAVQELRRQRDDPRRGRPQDVQEPQELPGPVRAHRRLRGRCGADLPDQLPGGAGRTAALPGVRGPRRGAHGDAAVLERLLLLHHLRGSRRAHRGRPGPGAPARAIGPRSTGGSSRCCRA